MHPDIDERCRQYLTAVRQAAPGLVEAVYLTGSVALGDYRSGRSDIDLAVLTYREPTEADLAALRWVHGEMPADPFLDGVYVPGSWLAEAPDDRETATVTQGEFRPNGSDELTPVYWFTLARHGIPVLGPTPDTLSIGLDQARLRRYNLDNLRGYWQVEADRARLRLAERDPAAELNAYLLVWVVLGAARLHATLGTGEIISKSAAGRYVAEHFPRFAELAERAVRWRHGEELTFTVADGYAAAELTDHVVSDAWQRWG